MRDQLRWQQIISEGEDCSDSNDMQERNYEKIDNDLEDGIVTNKTRNRLAALREYLKQYGGMAGMTQRSLDSPLQTPSSFHKSNAACTKEVVCNDDTDNSNN